MNPAGLKEASGSEPVRGRCNQPDTIRTLDDHFMVVAAPTFAGRGSGRAPSPTGVMSTVGGMIAARLAGRAADALSAPAMP